MQPGAPRRSSRLEAYRSDGYCRRGCPHLAFTEHATFSRCFTANARLYRKLGFPCESPGISEAKSSFSIKSSICRAISKADSRGTLFSVRVRQPGHGDLPAPVAPQPFCGDLARERRDLAEEKTGSGGPRRSPNAPATAKHSPASIANTGTGQIVRGDRLRSRYRCYSVGKIWLDFLDLLGQALIIPGQSGRSRSCYTSKGEISGQYLAYRNPEHPSWRRIRPDDWSASRWIGPRPHPGACRDNLGSHAVTGGNAIPEGIVGRTVLGSGTRLR